MIFIRHRVNTVSELRNCTTEEGAEIDLRSNPSQPGRLHLAHNPWTKGEDFEDWITVFKSRGLKGPLVLNTKEDLLEDRAIEICKSAGVESFLFLDTTSPTLVRWARSDLAPRFFVRISRFEPLEAALQLPNGITWAWLDCFDGEPLDLEVVKRVRGRFKVCLVSPELHGKPLDSIAAFTHLTAFADAVCTKAPDRWR